MIHGGGGGSKQLPLSSTQRCTDKHRQYTPLSTDNKERSLSDEPAFRHTHSHTHTHTRTYCLVSHFVSDTSTCVSSQPSLRLPDRKYGSKLHVSTSLIPPAEPKSSFLDPSAGTEKKKKLFGVFFLLGFLVWWRCFFFPRNKLLQVHTLKHTCTPPLALSQEMFLTEECV